MATTTRPDHAEAGRLLLNALAERDEHSARLADNAVVLISQADREQAQAASIAQGFDALARAVVTVPYDPAMRLAAAQGRQPLPRYPARLPPRDRRRRGRAVITRHTRNTPTDQGMTSR